MEKEVYYGILLGLRSVGALGLLFIVGQVLGYSLVIIFGRNFETLLEDGKDLFGKPGRLFIKTMNRIKDFQLLGMLTDSQIHSRCLHKTFKDIGQERL